MKSVLSELKIKKIDFLNINCEGCEFDLLESIIYQGVLPKINTIQVQFHPGLVVNGTSRRCHIRQILDQNFKENYNIPWIWERWSRTHQI